VLDKGIVRVAEVGQHRVFVDRHCQVAIVDLGAGVQGPDFLFEGLPTRKGDQRFGDLTLAVAVGW
jgi:hypothetical protein